MLDSSHTHTHHTINQIEASQSLPFNCLMSSLRPTLWGSVSELTQGYRVDFDTICNNPRKSVSHICAIPQNDQSKLRFLLVVNKAQFNLVYARCGTHHIPTHITQINQIWALQFPPLKSLTSLLGPTLQGSVLSPHGVTGPALIPYVTTQGKALVTSALYLKRTSHN